MFFFTSPSWQGLKDLAFQGGKAGRPLTGRSQRAAIPYNNAKTPPLQRSSRKPNKTLLSPPLELEKSVTNKSQETGCITAKIAGRSHSAKADKN